MAKAEGKQYQIKMFSEAYKEARAKRGLRTLKKTRSDPVRYTTIDQSGGIWDFSARSGGKLRIGKPKNKWAAEALSSIWEILQEKLPEHVQDRTRFNTAKTWVSGNNDIIRKIQAILVDRPGLIEKAIRNKFNVRHAVANEGTHMIVLAQSGQTSDTGFTHMLAIMNGSVEGNPAPSSTHDTMDSVIPMGTLEQELENIMNEAQHQAEDESLEASIEVETS